MDKYILLGVGSPSDLKELEKPSKRLGGANVFEYMQERSIKQLEKPLQVSCHRTLDHAVSYAKDIDDFAAENKVVAVFCGGLSLALPGIVASQTTFLPVIGVPFYSGSTHGGGLDSATAVYNLPPGTVVAGAPVHFPGENPSIDKAVLLAEKVIDFADAPIMFIGAENSKQAKAVLKLINPPAGRPNDMTKGVFGLEYIHKNMPLDPKETLDIALSICEDDTTLRSIDNQSILALQSRTALNLNSDIKPHERWQLEWNSFQDTVRHLDRTTNTLYFARSENAALFATRIAAMGSKEVHVMLRKYAHEKAIETRNKYGPKLRLSKYSFNVRCKDEKST